MGEEDKDKSNLEEDFQRIGDTNTQEIDLPSLIGLYGKKRLTNISEEEIQALQKEILKGKAKIGPSTQNQGSPSRLGIKTTQLKPHKKTNKGRKRKRQKAQETKNVGGKSTT
jgi:hypothetical protein